MAQKWEENQTKAFFAAARLIVSLLARVLRVCSGSLIGMIRNVCDYPAFLLRMPGFKGEICLI